MQNDLPNYKPHTKCTTELSIPFEEASKFIILHATFN